MSAGTPSRNNGQSRHSARGGRWILAIGAVVILVGGGWLLKVATSSPVANPIAPSVAGEPITSLGEYRSPDGNTLLILMETVDAKKIIVESKYRPKDKPNASAMWQIDAAQPWHYVFGNDGKVWGYSGDIGLHSWHGTPTGSKFTNIGIYGGWPGMPESFLASLPQEHRDVHAQWLANQNFAQQP